MAEYDNFSSSEIQDEPIKSLGDYSAPQDAHLIHDLHTIYHPLAEANAHSLDYVWQSITQHERYLRSLAKQHHQAILNTSEAQRQTSPMKFSLPPPTKRHTLRYAFGMIAAVIMITFLFGSMVAIIHAVQQSKTTQAAHSHAAFSGTTPTTPTTSATSSVKAASPAGIYITSMTAQSDYQISKLNPNTHNVLWSHEVGEISSSIVVANGVIYVSAGNSNPSSTANYVYALKAANGTVLWRVSLDSSTATVGASSPFYTGVLSTPTIANGMVYVTARDGKLFALNAANGAKVWTYDSGAPTVVNGTVYDANHIAIANGIVYASSHNALFALDAISGKLAWSTQIDNQQLFNAPQVVDSVLYLSSYQASQHNVGQSQTGYVYAFSTQHGIQRWRYSVGNWVLSDPAIVNGIVYFGSYNFNIYALTASNGKLLWTYNTGGEVYDTPLITDGVLYTDEAGNANEASLNGVSTVQPALLAINAINGTLIWRYKSATEFTPQAMQNGILYAGTQPGMVYAFSAKNCSEIWHQKYGAYLVDKFGNVSGPSPEITLAP